MSNIWIIDTNEKPGKLWAGVYLFLLVFIGILVIGKLYFNLFYEVGKLIFKKIKS